MIDRIQSWAEETDGVRAAVLTGSRAAKGAPLDELSDYDVALFLDDPGALEASASWFDVFGDVLVSLPDVRDEMGHRVATRLVQYADGARIDFSLFPVDMLRVISILPELPPWLDAGYRVLHDPERLTGPMVPPHGRGYAGRLPGAEEVVADVEEFLWEALVVAKELARGNAFAAAHSAEGVMRHSLMRRMLEWAAGAAAGWARAPGMVGRGLEAMLPDELSSRAKPAITDWSGAAAWDELARMLDLYAELADDVAAAVGAEYPTAAEQGVRDRIAHIRAMLVDSEAG